ncbi:MAG: hypothetical protein Q8Q76_09970 [Methylotenera sp.]|nr:hypothetical protein [Methylotenera sp.]
MTIIIKKLEKCLFVKKAICKTIAVAACPKADYKLKYRRGWFAPFYEEFFNSI